MSLCKTKWAFFGPQVAVKSAKTASVGAKRNSELSTKFAHILAKASTVEGKQLLQGGSRNKALVSPHTLVA
jgi:hypothetical protein